MEKKNAFNIQVDDQGRLILPQEVIARLGLLPGTAALIDLNDDGIRISNPTGRVARVYVEVTNACNLDCRICMRNVWDEPLGWMKDATFDRILEGVKEFSPTPLIFFGGYGEPLAHPEFHQFLLSARKAGIEIELITNGILLDAESAALMVEVGVQRVWVSIDGATPQHYADVRLGDALPQVVENLKGLQTLRAQSKRQLPKLGIAFVAMKRNIEDLPAVIELGRRLGADKISVSNILPHTSELRDEELFKHSLSDADRQPSRWSVEVSLPRLDWDEPTGAVLGKLLSNRNNLRIADQNLTFGINKCPFQTKASLSIRWDGTVAPCLPLLHTHTSFLGNTQRIAYAHSFGNITDQGLSDIWNDRAYVAFRQRVQQFDFSPCAFCNSCSMSESNQLDCFASDQPTCGGCLWAQGFIQCP